MGSICGSPQNDEEKTYVHSIFKQRTHNGEMFEKVYFEDDKMERIYDRDPYEFQLNKDSVKYKEEQQGDVLKEKFKNQQWLKYQDLCTYETRRVPVAGGKRSIVLCQIQPKGDIMKSNKAYIFGHQGGGLMFDIEQFVLEGFRTAVLFKSQVFLVDFWKDNNKAPTGAKDFAESIEYINNNSTKFGIHKDHLCVGGAGAGGWVLLGALFELIKRNNIDIIDAAFFISPIVDDAMGKVGEHDLAKWEKKWAKQTTGFFNLMAKDYNKQQADPELYPMRGQKHLIQRMPPCVIFTSEFDYNRRDAMFLRDLLQKEGKLLDWHDMPGVGNLYHYDCTLPHSYWFFKDLTLAFEKYVKKSDQLQELAASFKASAKSLQA